MYEVRQMEYELILSSEWSNGNSKNEFIKLASEEMEIQGQAYL